MDIGKDLQDAFMDGYNYRDAEIVRCKDCKHYREADPGHPNCDWCNRMICGTIRKGFFCADGERKDEEA